MVNFEEINQCFKGQTLTQGGEGHTRCHLLLSSCFAKCFYMAWWYPHLPSLHWAILSMLDSRSLAFKKCPFFQVMEMNEFFQPTGPKKILFFYQEVEGKLQLWLEITPRKLLHVCSLLSNQWNWFRNRGQLIIRIKIKSWFSCSKSKAMG